MVFIHGNQKIKKMFDLLKKICGVCQKEKPLILFHKNRTVHSNICLECKNIENKKSQAANYGKRETGYKPNFGKVL